jgi:uncharacterized membrane protein
MVQKRFIFAFLALMLALSLVSAFSIDSGNDVSVCAGTTSTIIDTISEQGSYSITSSGSASSFSTTIPSGLIADEQGVIYSYISPPSTALPGDYELTVNVKGNNEVREAKHNIKVTDCHAAALSIDSSSKTSCTCEEAVFLLTLKNSGGYLESYNIFAEGTAKKWVTLSDSVVIVGPGEEKAVKAYVKAPCDVYGKYDITFKAQSTTSLSVSTTKASLDIKPCYEYSLEIPKSYYSLCEDDSLKIPLKVNNLGTADNLYTLSLNAPEWINLENKQAIVKSLQSYDTNVIVNPPYLASGNFTLLIEGVSKTGDVKKSVDAKINVEKCYNVLVDIDKDKDRLCNAVSNKYQVMIKNTGKYTNSFDVNIDIEWASLSESRLELKSDESKTIDLDVHPSYDTSAKAYTLTVKAIDPVSKASYSDSINIDVATLEQCYQPSIKAKVDNLELSKDSTATDLIILENKGTEEATYILDLSGTSSKFSELNPGIVTIAPGKAEAVYLYVAPNLLVNAGNYEAIVTARMKDTTILSSRTIGIKVIEGKEVSKPVEVKEEKTEVVVENLTNKTGFIERIGQGFSKLGNGISSATSITGKAIESSAKWVGKTASSAVSGIGGFFSRIASSLRPIEAPLPENITASQLKQGFMTGDISENQMRTYFKSNNLSDESIQLFVDEWTSEKANITAAAKNSAIKETIKEENNQSEIKINLSIEKAPAPAKTPEEIPEIATGTGNETLIIETQNLTGAINPKINLNFDFSKYKKYIIGAVVIILIMLLFITGAWKKMIEFFEEEVEEPKANGKKNGKKK